MKRILILSLCLFVSVSALPGQRLTDPTRPSQDWLKAPAEQKSQISELSWPKVQAVMHRQGRYLALIAGQWYAEGDRWQEIKITRIRPTEVTFAGPEGLVKRQVGSSNTIKKVAKDEV
ncbi:hypothetical protein HMF8227_00274 [Saliniradius amylolyticus]|uniref:Uncharacterized protein n=1 Tax=Saliniradius amylolyticus TaxID=2183582 RepID=A0A2S2DZR9_9ALTE|nr:hypothetical protein [Saliniradius amylolyticus]AWL10782.1 hypothetical protein HMF8227_00274 [Saliniradius amylolyticus]